jgi:hypothetical protein
MTNNSKGKKDNIITDEGSEVAYLPKEGKLPLYVRIRSSKEYDETEIPVSDEYNTFVERTTLLTTFYGKELIPSAPAGPKYSPKGEPGTGQIAEPAPEAAPIAESQQEVEQPPVAEKTAAPASAPSSPAAEEKTNTEAEKNRELTPA